MKEIKTLAYILYAVAIPIIIAGAIWTANTSITVLNSKKADGTIIEVINNGKSLPHLVIEFTTPDKRNVQFRTSGNSLSHAEGESLHIIYEENHPRNANIDSFSTLWLYKLILICMGIGIFGMAFLIHSHHRNIQKINNKAKQCMISSHTQ